MPVFPKQAEIGQIRSSTYNFWQSPRIEAQDIIEAHQKQTSQRGSSEEIILAIQDTSDFNFTHHQSKTEEQGFGMTCAQKYVRGLKVHSLMASTTQGVPLGILEQQIWTRPLKTKKKKNQKTRQSILNKESKIQDRSVTLNVISVLEEHPNSEFKPIEWLLLTTLEVNHFEQAVRYLRWYTYRWLIERYHYVLKSGCRIEQLQLKTAERIKKALATYTIVAWRLLWLTYQARENPLLPCDTILEKYEWQSLCCHFQGFPLSKDPPTLQQAIIWIAQLGGFLARRHDGFPGVKTLWRGLQRLYDIASTWKLLHSSKNIEP